ncbi:hypothetical protein ACOMHN_023178 [Nucella lapillus]
MMKTGRTYGTTDGTHTTGTQMPSTPADACQVETTTTGTEIHQAVTASGMGPTMPGIKQGKAHTLEPTHHSASIRGLFVTHQMRKRWAGTPRGQPCTQQVEWESREKEELSVTGKRKTYYSANRARNPVIQ